MRHSLSKNLSFPIPIQQLKAYKEWGAAIGQWNRLRAPTILPKRVRVPSTLSMLFVIYEKNKN